MDEIEMAESTTTYSSFKQGEPENLRNDIFRSDQNISSNTLHSYQSLNDDDDDGDERYETDTLIERKDEGEEESEGSDDYYNSTYLLGVSVLASLGGFVFGYDTGVISGATLTITKDFELEKSTYAIPLIVSGTVGGSIIGSLLSALLNDLFGRKPCIIIAAFICLCGAVVMAIAPTWIMLCVGRVIVGVGIGIESATIPMYVAEVAPTNIRGKLTVINNVLLTGGQFVSLVFAGIFSYVDEGWRYSFGLGAVPAAIQMIGFFFMPESPRWLLAKGRRAKALEAHRLLRGPDAELPRAPTEQDGDQSATSMVTTSELGKESFLEQIKHPHVYRALFLGCSLQIFQQVAGINTVMYYSGTIIKMAGISSNDSVNIWLAAGVSFFNFAFTVVAIFLVEKAGRRWLLLASACGVIVSLVLLSGSFYAGQATAPPLVPNTTIPGECYSITNCFDCLNQEDCGFNPPTYSCVASNNKTLYPEVTDSCPNKYGSMSVIALSLYLVFFAPGLGAMPWLLNGEIYPISFRGTGSGISSATNWITNLVVTFTFMLLLKGVGTPGTFMLYAGVSVLATVLMYFICPETKGKTFEEIKSGFSNGWVQIKLPGRR